MGFPRPSLIPSSVLGGDAIGDYYYFEDFVGGGQGTDATDAQFDSSTALIATWLRTATNDGTIIRCADAEAGGALHITTDTADNDGYEFQMNGEAFLPAAGKDIYFEARLKLTAAVAPLTSIDWFVGYSVTDTTVMDGVTNRFGLGSNGLDAGGADIYAITEAASTQTDADTGVNYVDNTYFTIAAHMISNGRIKYFVNGKDVATFSTNIATGAMTPTFIIQNNAGAAKQMLIDYLFFTQTR